RFSLFPSPAPTSVWLVRDCFTGSLDLRCFCHCWASSSTGWPSRSHPFSQTCSSSSVGGGFRVMKRPRKKTKCVPLAPSTRACYTTVVHLFTSFQSQMKLLPAFPDGIPLHLKNGP